MSIRQPQNPGLGGLDELTGAEELTIQQISGLGDPNADRILFWDDSAGQFEYLTAGTGLSITGTTIEATSGSGTVTSVAALTLGTTGTDLSSTVANGTTTPVITLQVPTASATNRGVLSSTDWTTFNNKADLWVFSNYEQLANKATTFGTINDTLYPTVKAVNDAITSAVIGLLDYRGSYDASTNLFPATGGSGIAGAVLKGDFWMCSVAGTLGTVAVTAGDLIIALVDTPAQTAANWDLIQHDLNGVYLPKAGGIMTGNLLFTDNTLDIGASGATRPRTLYLGTGATIPALTATTINGNTLTTGTGTITITGTKTLTVADTASVSGTNTGDNTVATALTGTPSITVATVTTTGDIELGNASDTTLHRVSAGVASIEGKNIALNGTSEVLTTGTIELGHATDTTLSRSAAGTLAIEGIRALTTTPLVVSATSYTTDTGTSLNMDNLDQFVITAQAGALLFNAPGGTLVQGRSLIIRIKDNGTARALTWNAVFRAMGTALPSTTILSKTLYLGFFYNSTDSAWDLVASAQEA